MRVYADWENQLVIAHYRDRGPEFLIPLLNQRTLLSIKLRARKLKVSNAVAPPWTIAELNIIRRCHPDLHEAAKLLPGRTFEAVTTRSKILRLKSHKRWTAAEDELLHKLWPTHSNPELAAMLGRTARAVRKRRSDYGLVRASNNIVRHRPLMVDLLAEAQRRGVRLTTLTKALGCPRLKPGRTDHQTKTVTAQVRVLGGEVYAEWDD
jgi:hypothetical protein